MPESKRRLDQRIVDYLDAKAKNSKVTELRTIKTYATIDEIAKNLHSTETQVRSLVESLLNQNRIKEFPSVKTGKKFYGSIILPAVTKVSDDDETFAADSKKKGSFRIYCTELTIRNLIVSLK
jgi:hypothetical protein